MTVNGLEALRSLKTRPLVTQNPTLPHRRSLKTRPALSRPVTQNPTGFKGGSSASSAVPHGLERRRLAWRMSQLGDSPSLFRLALARREAVSKVVLPSEALQMFAEGGFGEAIDRHRVAVPHDAVTDLLEDVRRNATTRLRLQSRSVSRSVRSEREPGT